MPEKTKSEAWIFCSRKAEPQALESVWFGKNAEPELVINYRYKFFDGETEHE